MNHHEFGSRSEGHLADVHPKLNDLMNNVLRVSHLDIVILEACRPVWRQKKLFDAGKSKIDGINKLGRHNYYPSLALDWAPYPIDWHDESRFYLVAGVIMAKAIALAIPIRWGGDWDMDGSMHDQKFHDIGHIELVGDPKELDVVPYNEQFRT